MYIREYLLQEEEVKVGSIDNLYISVYPEPLKNPSFHIRTKTFETECVYQIKDFKLLEQKTKSCFSSKELKEISKWFKETSKVFPPFTNWQVLIKDWNRTNEDVPVDVDLQQPEF